MGVDELRDAALRIEYKNEPNQCVAPLGLVSGLTKRELYAAMAMQGLSVSMFPTDSIECSRFAVIHAEALIKALESK